MSLSKKNCSTSFTTFRLHHTSVWYTSPLPKAYSSPCRLHGAVKSPPPPWKPRCFWWWTLPLVQNYGRWCEEEKTINDILEAMAKQLYDYWFVQFDFPNEEGKPYKSSGGAMVWNEKLKREIPTSFVVKSLSEIIEVKDGTHDSPKPQDNGYFLLTSKHLTERGLDYASAYKISKEDYESINKRSIYY